MEIIIEVGTRLVVEHIVDNIKIWITITDGYCPQRSERSKGIDVVVQVDNTKAIAGYFQRFHLLSHLRGGGIAQLGDVVVATIQNHLQKSSGVQLLTQ